MLKVNEYFGGSVKSIALTTEEGPATVGVIEPGTYEFGTSTIEVMKVVSGLLAAKLPGAAEWAVFGPGQSFTVPAGVRFQVEAKADVAYLCLYR